MKEKDTSQRDYLYLVLFLQLHMQPGRLRDRSRESKLDKKNASDEGGTKSHPGTTIVPDGVIKKHSMRRAFCQACLALRQIDWRFEAVQQRGPQTGNQGKQSTQQDVPA